jgi:molybdenum cofactor cytidylyltransferase
MNDAWHSFAIVPAAGRSIRMGQPKLLLPWRGQTVIEHTIAAWRASAVTRIVVVIRPDDSQLAEIANLAGADVVIPEVAPPEMKDSIRIALEHVARSDHPTEVDVWLLAPADMPWLSANVIRELLAAHRPSEPRILVPVQGEQRGHPVLFPWSLAKEVATLTAQEGVNALLDRHGWTPVPVSVDFIHGDLDTPEDYNLGVRR